MIFERFTPEEIGTTKDWSAKEFAPTEEGDANFERWAGTEADWQRDKDWADEWGMLSDMVDESLGGHAMDEAYSTVVSAMAYVQQLKVDAGPLWGAMPEEEARLKKLNMFKERLTGMASRGDIAPSDIESANRRPIQELVGGARKAGRNFKALCPFHEEKTPSFTVYPDNHWYCYGCNKGGDAIEFAMKREGLSFPDAVRSLR